MNKVLYLLLISTPIFSMQPAKDAKPNLAQPRQIQQQDMNNIVHGAMFVARTPVLRDAAISAVVLAASAVPYLAPPAVVVGIGMRIAMDNQKDNRK